MSFDIDMQSYAGAKTDPVAVDQVVETNSYQQEGEEYPVNAALLDQPSDPNPIQIEKPVVPDSNPQAENFRALREEIDRYKTEKEADKREYQNQLDMMRANISQNQRRESEPAPKQMFDGMKDEDLANVGELRREWAERESNYQAKLEELQVQQTHSDYIDVIEKYAVPLIRQKPHLAEGLKGASNKALYAYELGKMSQQMQAQQSASQPVVAQKSSDAQRIVENARKPGTLSQGAGGQAALSKADYFATMSDAEFMKMASKNLDSI